MYKFLINFNYIFFLWSKIEIYLNLISQKKGKIILVQNIVKIGVHI